METVNAPAVAPDTSSVGNRQAWVDNLRTLMILLVVNMHACVTYSHVGSWYYKVDPEPPLLVKVPFIFWQGHLQAFFMGLLFFIAGIFAHRSLQRRGPASFLRERAFRLGLPSLFYMAVLHPVILFFLLGYPHTHPQPPMGARWLGYYSSLSFWRGSGPMWFALALLVFCIILAGWRALRSADAPAERHLSSPPRAGTLVVFGVALVLASFAVRLVQPLGTSILNFQLCYFPQYIAAFATGVLAARNDWADRLASSSLARKAGWLGLIGGPLLMAAMLASISEGELKQVEGGWNIHAFTLATWEQLSGLALGLGCLSYFRRHWNSSTPLTRWLSERSFAVYVLHAPVLVALTPLLQPFAVNRYLGMLELTAVGLFASYLLADAAKRVPGLKQIL